MVRAAVSTTFFLALFLAACQNHEGMNRGGETDSHGVYTFPDGGRYDGEWLDGKKNGHGVYIAPNGVRMDGEWQDNRMIGHGVMTLPDSTRYEGEFLDGKMNGHGVMTLADGERYEGEWLNNRATGYGINTWPSGARYEGEWRDSKMNGHGVYTRPDGQRYEGEWMNNFPLTRVFNSGPDSGNGNLPPGKTPTRSLAEIQQMFDRNKGYFIETYNHAVGESAVAGEGDIAINISIDPSGVVTSCNVVYSTFNNPDFEQKIVEKVMLFRFAAKNVPSFTTISAYNIHVKPLGR